MATTFVRPFRVLLAEDNPVNQMFAARVVEKQGHSVCVVANGRLAIDAVRHEAFDVVLMDIGMPVLDGLEAVRELRQLEKQTGCHLPVIAMTSNASDPDRDRYLAAGMDDLIGKPVQAADLAAVMARVLQVTPRKCIDIGTSCPVEAESVKMSSCDLTAALRRVGGDLSFLQQLGLLFLDTVPQQLESLRTAMQAHDRKRIGDQSHSIKGSLRHFFAATAYDSAQQLELISMNGDEAVIEEIYEQLLNEVGRLRTELISKLSLIREAGPNSGVT